MAPNTPDIPDSPPSPEIPGGEPGPGIEIDTGQDREEINLDPNRETGGGERE